MTTQKTLITDISQAATILADNNIELITFTNNISYSSDLSQMYYDEFITGADGLEVQSFGNRQTDYIVIYGDDVKPNDKHFKKWQLLKMNKTDLLKVYYSLGLYSYDETSLKADIVDELYYLDNEDYYKYLYKESCYIDLKYDFSVYGYSQGDYIKVLKVGNVPAYINSDHLQNIFFNTPIGGSIEVYTNGVLLDEIYADELLTDAYNWDKVQFINAVSNATIDRSYHVLLNKYLIDNLPDNLEYI